MFKYVLRRLASQTFFAFQKLSIFADYHTIVISCIAVVQYQYKNHKAGLSLQKLTSSEWLHLLIFLLFSQIRPGECCAIATTTAIELVENIKCIKFKRTIFYLELLVITTNQERKSWWKVISDRD